MNYQRFLVRCSSCGSNTSKKYAAAHAGQCKACAEPEKASKRDRDNGLLIDSGYSAYARERGDYDLPDNY